MINQSRKGNQLMWTQTNYIIYLRLFFIYFYLFF